MVVIAIRLLTLLAVAYLFGLLTAWVFSLFNSDEGGDDFRRGEPDAPQPPDPGKTFKFDADTNKKRLVEVDESYYLEEFDLSKK
ncbi:MAG: LapA family protein [Cyanobacteria bacterium J06623_7]